MADDVQQDRTHEEDLAPAQVTVDLAPGETEPLPKRSRKAKTTPVIGHEKDAGPWKFKPWCDLDHWVHETTGASSFDLKTIK